MSYEAWGDGDDDPFEPAIEAGWINPDDQTKALIDVMNERLRQQDAEGWSAEHDDEHKDGSIALAGACYAMFASVSDSARASTELPGSLSVTGKPIAGWAAWLEIWPWERRFWKPKDRRSDLVRAAALLLAEIERLDRAEAREKGAK